MPSLILVTAILAFLLLVCSRATSSPLMACVYLSYGMGLFMLVAAYSAVQAASWAMMFVGTGGLPL